MLQPALSFNYSPKCFFNPALSPAVGQNATQAFAGPLCNLSAVKTANNLSWASAHNKSFKTQWKSW